MISVDQVKELRNKTGLSVMECRKALEEAGGDFDKAIGLLRRAGGAAAEKKSGRALGAGVVQSYIHNTAAVGSIVELSCETDFVAKNEEFRNLAYDIAMQVAATDPQFIRLEDISDEARNAAKQTYAEEVRGKPMELKDKILEGRLIAYFGEKTLLEQPFIKGSEVKVKDLLTNAVQKFGERIEVRRFVRFSTQS